jgi:hypothetical protein
MGRDEAGGGRWRSFQVTALARRFYEVYEEIMGRKKRGRFHKATSGWKRYSPRKDCSQIGSSRSEVEKEGHYSVTISPTLVLEKQSGVNMSPNFVLKKKTGADPIPDQCSNATSPGSIVYCTSKGSSLHLV